MHYAALQEDRMFKRIIERFKHRQASPSAALVPGPPRWNILVYVVGKVGSMSVYKSLRALKLPEPVWHVQHMSEESIADMKDLYGSDPQRRHKYEKALKLRSEILDNENAHWKVITLVREPIAWSLSSFAHRLDHYVPKDVLSDARDHFDQHADFFQGTFDRTAERMERVLSNWFDEEMKALFNIDVFDIEFIHQRGYTITIYPDRRVELLIIRLEDLNRVYKDAFREFLEIDNMELVTHNVSTDQDFGQITRKFREGVVIGPEFMDAMYGLKWARHFYTEEEIARFRAKWSGG